jgi:branched-chain amino acid transport system substrate-binding protein
VRAVRLAVVVGVLSAFAVVLSACGNDVSNGVKGSAPDDNKKLTVYASLPLRGPEAPQARHLENGMKLAFAEHKGVIDGNHIVFDAMDDTGPDGNWDDGQVADNARIAVRDRTTVAYLGELDSGASALSIPILNEAGVLQVSPTSGYAGLTRAGVVQGEPDKYYPSGKRSFGRIAPNDHVQAMAQVDYQREQGCKTVYLLNDEEVYGTGLTREMETLTKSGGPQIVGNDEFEISALDYTDIAKAVAAKNPDCVFFGGGDIPSAIRMWRALHHAAGHAKLFGPDRLVTSRFTSRIGNAGGATFLTSPMLRRSDYPPQAHKVFRAYKKRYGESADLDSLYGYATMDAVLDAVAAGKGSGSRQKRTIESFFDLDQDSVLGKFSIDDNGDTSLSKYGSYIVRAGKPVFAGIIDTAK